jgi:ABC-2 type transport system permease protein
MTGFLALLRKQSIESRWVFVLTFLAIFGFGWLCVYLTSRTESRIRREAARGVIPRLALLRGMGVSSMEPSPSLIMTAIWRSNPFILLTIAVWSISRGSVAVAGEVERGTLDLIISRPVSRTQYLTAQVVFAVAGLLALGVALIAGSLAATRYNTLSSPLSAVRLIKPALNLSALGLAIYGYTLLLSALDSVRWRPNLVASSLTLAGFIAWIVSLSPVMADSPWKPWLERLSIFHAFDPVDAVSGAEHLAYNLALLGSIGAVGIVAAWVAFSLRDLPANS